MIKRKEIVIGEQYVYDVLNETNLAATTSLVTVVRETNEENVYTVLSVNTGDIFDCHAKYLTPFISPDKAYAVRFVYGGQSEFDYEDMIVFDHVIEHLLYLMESVRDSIPEPDRSEIFTKDDLGRDVVASSRAMIERTKKKVFKYAQMSAQRVAIRDNIFLHRANMNRMNADFKQMMGPYFPSSIMDKVQSDMSKLQTKSMPGYYPYPPIPPTGFTNPVSKQPYIDKIKDKEAQFNQIVGPVIHKFVMEEISEDEFISTTKHLIRKHFPIESLIMKAKPISREEEAINIFKYIDGMEDDSYLFFICPDAKRLGELAIMVIKPTDSVEDNNIKKQVRDFIFTMYPHRNGVPDNIHINTTVTYAALELHNHTKDEYDNNIEDEEEDDYE